METTFVPSSQQGTDVELKERLQTIQLPSSICFSPAGLLFCSYHLGVAAVLQTLIKDDETAGSIEVIGASAGALTAIALKFRIPYEKFLLTIKTVGRQKNDDDSVSLVDKFESFMPRMIKESLGGTPENNYEDFDKSRFRILSQNLKIGVTHRRTHERLKSTVHRFKGRAFCYVDNFRDVEDVVAACLISGFVPGGTGPKDGRFSKVHGTVARCSVRLKEMEGLGYIKSPHNSHEPVWTQESFTKLRGKDAKQPAAKRRESYVDGGMTQCLPCFHKETVLVCPFPCSHERNPLVAPSCDCAVKGRRRWWIRILPKTVKFGKSIFHVCDCQWEAWQLIVKREYGDEYIERLFWDGYNDAVNYFGVESQTKGDQIEAETASSRIQSDIDSTD